MLHVPGSGGCGQLVLAQQGQQLFSSDEVKIRSGGDFRKIAIQEQTEWTWEAQLNEAQLIKVQGWKLGFNLKI